MAKTKTKKKTKKAARLTLAEIKLRCAELGLQVAEEYDKRYKNTWLYTMGDKSVEPVLRTSIVHVKKKEKKKISWDDLVALGNN